MNKHILYYIKTCMYINVIEGHNMYLSNSILHLCKIIQRKKIELKQVYILKFFYFVYFYKIA